jgi:pantetheine-phosphate adenylyltransferase
MTTAIYAGTFDPMTEGHLSVVQQAARLFGHVIVLVALNPNKHTLFTPDERVAIMREVLDEIPNVRVSQSEGLVVQYARRVGATVLLRGVRSAMDAQFETELAQQNRELAPEIATLFLPAFAELSSVSSSRLKEMVRNGEDASPYCPPQVLALLRQRLAQAPAVTPEQKP